MNKKWRPREVIFFSSLLLSGLAISIYSMNAPVLAYAFSWLGLALFASGYILWLFVDDHDGRVFALACGLVIGTTANTIHPQHQVLGTLGVLLTSVSMLFWKVKLWGHS